MQGQRSERNGKELRAPPRSGALEVGAHMLGEEGPGAGRSTGHITAQKYQIQRYCAFRLEKVGNSPSDRVGTGTRTALHEVHRAGKPSTESNHRRRPEGRCTLATDDPKHRSPALERLGPGTHCSCLRDHRFASPAHRR